jgi:hypothetical protein
MGMPKKSTHSAVYTLKAEKIWNIARHAFGDPALASQVPNARNVMDSRSPTERPLL